MSMPSPEVFALLEATFDATVITDEQGRMLAFNAAAEEMFGYRAADALGRNVGLLLVGKEAGLRREGSAREFLDEAEARVPGPGRDVGLRHRDGSEFTALLCVGKIPHSSPPRYVVRFHDTSQRRRALDTLERERQLHRLYFDLAQVMLVATDRDGRVQLLNQRALRVLGKSAAEIVGIDWVDSCVAPADRCMVREALRALLLERHGEPQGFECHVRAADGDERFLTWRGIAWRDAQDEVSGIMLSGEDITDQRRAEMEAHHAQERVNSVARLATMGEMAAGISHELNQPLAAIANYAQACARLLRLPSADLAEIGGALEQISAQALRAGEIIRRIRSLVRNEDVRREPQDINALIREVHALLATDARVHDGSLTLDLAEPAPAVNVDRLQIQQVLINLVHNAFEATGSHAASAPDPVRITTRLTQAGDVEISVNDQGPGLADELEQRIFEPFFTTKATGTGLGLAISRSIIKAHGSKLGYRTNSPCGASFFFVLPAFRETLT